MSNKNGQAFSSSAKNCEGEKDGSKKMQEDSQKTVKEESTRTEQHHSSFQSARSVFESTPSILISKKETISSSRTHSQSTVLQSFHTVNTRKQPNFVTFRSPEKDKVVDNYNTQSPNKTPPDKPDRKSKATSSKSVPSRPNGSLVNDVIEDKNCNNSIPVATNRFSDIKRPPHQDPRLVSG